MTDQHTHDPTPGEEAHDGQRSHSWLMIACCIPMLVIAFALVVTGVASPGFILAAIGCTVMMAVMMRAMDHDGGDEQ